MNKTAEKVYATALFELASEQDRVDYIYKEFTDLITVLNNESDLCKVFSLPSVSVEEKINLAVKIFEGNLDETVLNFVLVLIENNRIQDIMEIYKSYKIKYYEIKGILEVRATTAFELSEVLRAKLIAKLESISNKKIELVENIDKSILGGIVINFQNTQLDASVKARIEDMKSKIDSIIA